MKTKPFATTQWEYGPTGFGWFGSSGTSFIFTRDCGGTQKHCDTPHRGPRRKLPSSGSKVSRETGVLRVPWMQEYIKLGRCSEGKSFRAEAMGEGSMSKRSLALRVGGAAGDGVSSTAESFAKISARSGLHTWTYSSYQSVIRGGHVWTQVRGGLDPLLSHGDDPDVVLCLNQQTMDVHQADVIEGGAIIYDVDSVKPDPTKIRKNVRLIGIPLRKKAQTLSPNALMRNTVALGAAVALFAMDFRHVESAFKDIWGDKKPEVVQQNVAAARLGADAVKDLGGPLPLGLAYPNQAKYLMTGNEALCLGALAAGVKFLAQYPMTPASSILHWMAFHGPKYAVVVQRSGPSTGLPTKTEQGDLNLALGAGQGDWPRAILAPRHPEECFSLTAKAFNLAEIYQTPISVISDLYLGEGYRTVDKLDFNVPIVRGMMAADGGTAKDFKRYEITESGVSPRALPGTKGYQFIGATDEHMESGELISDVLAGLPEFVEERRKMHEKRMRKLDGLRKDTPRPEVWGPKNADLTVILWGSTWGAAHEAILQVEEKEGLKANSLEF